MLLFVNISKYHYFSDIFMVINITHANGWGSLFGPLGKTFKVNS